MNRYKLDDLKTLNVKFVAGFDETLYRCFYNESIVELTQDKGGVYFYTDCDNVTSPDLIDCLDLRIVKKNFKEFLNILYYEVSNIYNFETLTEFKELLQYHGLTTIKSDFKTWLKEFDDCFAGGLQGFDINLFERLESDGFIRANVELYTSRGYSQGDYAYILIDFERLGKAWGTLVKDKEPIKTYIDNICWDYPITYGLLLNGDYIALEGFDFYEKADFEKLNEVIKETLLDKCDLNDAELKTVLDKLLLKDNDYEIKQP